MNGGSGVSQTTVEKLVGNNYQYWKLCMEAYLQGQDLWDLIGGAETVIPFDTPKNREPRRKWNIKCGKALYALRTSISKDYIDHVREKDTPKLLWETLESLFTKKNTMRLQYLENELSGCTQGSMSISDYFLKIKNLCAEISELDPEEPIKEARLRRYLIRGLRKEFMPFISSVQGWATQPSIIELENLLTNQEALVKKMSSKPIFEADDVLFAKEKWRNKGVSKQSAGDGKQPREEAETREYSQACYRCGKSGHIKRNCRVKIKCSRCGKSNHIKKNCRVKLVDENANFVYENKDSDQLKWEHCFSIEVVEQVGDVDSVVHKTDAHKDSNLSINYEKEWIVDSGCSHHNTGNESLLSDVCPHKGKPAIVTADNTVHPVVKEGFLNVKFDRSSGTDITLNDVYHVPGLKKNLVSVSQITDSGRYVLFGPDDVKILENLKHVAAGVLFTGKKKESLYVLSATEAYVERTGQNTSASLWHARLGHIGYQMLQEISTNKLIYGIPHFKEVRQDVVCPGCQYGKSHRLPFHRSTN